MPLKIIVEGCDGAGKSHYISQLKELYPSAQVVHCTRSTPNTYRFFSMLLKDDKDYIFDRFHVGQFIYQTEEERCEKGWLTSHELKKLEKLMIKVGAQLIHVVAPIQTIVYNCARDREDNYYTPEYIRELCAKYDQFMLNSRVPVMEYYNDYNPDVAGAVDYESLPTVVAIDFDGTLVHNAFPNIKYAIPNTELIAKAKKLRKCGAKLVLWTNRTDAYLQDAVDYCASHGLYFDAINDNVKEVKDAGLNPRKVWATEYWDDKAVTV